MGKVICESPRYGHSNPSYKTARKYDVRLDWESGDYDEGPSRISTKRRRNDQYGVGAKELSDYLTPIHRFLRKSVGRLWDDVYSEISRTINKRSMSGNHLHTHIKMDVKTDIQMIDGVPHRIYYSGYWTEYSGFYVHPATGLLCYKPYKRRRHFNDVGGEVTKIHIHRETYFELFIIKKAFDGCSDFFPPKDESNGRRWTYVRYNDDDYVCQHGLKVHTKIPIWYVIEYGYHDPNEVYNVIRYEHATDRERGRYGLMQPGDIHKVYYKDTAKGDEKIVLSKRQANSRELKQIRKYLAGEDLTCGRLRKSNKNNKKTPIKTMRGSLHGK